ncbi:fam-a protein [Plasmodium vinckei]|uniref:Fam-a protein n=1 Tax=Plasmodium vinckei TaxID=5860 RepID=A0A6V7SNU2_PLAVN|nr:fam-a protein [Plasmodium vinckei]
MKVMSVGLISLIIFNIVLANNGSDSGPTTNSSSLLEEKTKKTHKTTEESINVKGNGPYEEDYEENYGDMIKDIFMSLEESYQYRRNNSHKQDDVPPPVSKGPKKQKFTKTKTESIIPYSTPEKIYKQNKQLLCNNPEEIKQAEELMVEAVEHLEYHATSKDGYESLGENNDSRISYYKKKHEGHTDVIKANLTFEDPNEYDNIIGSLWDPDTPDFFNKGSVKRKIVRMYNPNLVIIQQRYKDSRADREKYFYALAKKVQISEDATIIVMTSANINDHNTNDKEFYRNTLIKNANLFKTDIDSEYDIRTGKLKKTFVNIAGYLIKKIPAHVSITYINSVSDIQILTT